VIYSFNKSGRYLRRFHASALPEGAIASVHHVGDVVVERGQRLFTILNYPSMMEERALGQRGEAKPEGNPAMWIPEGEAKDG